MESRVCPMKLNDFSCQIKKSDSTGNDNQQKPVCDMTFKLEKTSGSIKTTQVQMELSKMDVLLDGLHKIKQQLSSVAASTANQ
ncbi:hypothetical protein LSTR_LSTR010764 [Laodelphax striatellus]|uniref:COMM domain-containing protein n=1 Tax=Laodelphax striatellus TaxID=195883 RepID=A0A482WMC9_LAOST|nr:hypothetical protein LSTR_LSTR010764 [Laodelphax striatellus]